MCAPTWCTGCGSRARRRRWISSLYIIFFLPAVAAFIYSGWNYAAMSIRFREVSIFSPAGVPVFPLKTLVPVTGVLLLLQGHRRDHPLHHLHPAGRLAAAPA